MATHRVFLFAPAGAGAVSGWGRGPLFAHKEWTPWLHFGCTEGLCAAGLLEAGDWPPLGTPLLSAPRSSRFSMDSCGSGVPCVLGPGPKPLPQGPISLTMPPPGQKQACMWLNMVSPWCTARGPPGHCGVGWGQPPRPPLTCCWGCPGRHPGPSGVPVPPVLDRTLVLPDQGVEVSWCPALDAEGAVEGARCWPRGCQQGTGGYSALPWRGAALAPPRSCVTAPGKWPWVSMLLSLRHGHSRAAV